MAAKWAGSFFFLLAASAAVVGSGVISGVGSIGSALAAGTGAVVFFLAALNRIVSVLIDPNLSF
jgi:hypothetical protein